MTEENVLRNILRQEIDIVTNKKEESIENREQFFIDCMLSECSFTSTFGAFGGAYKVFVEESKKLSELLNLNIDGEQLNAIHYATGVLPSSMLYFNRADKIDKKYGDMIIDGLSREIGYISSSEDKKYIFLSDISNYKDKYEVMKKIEDKLNNMIFEIDKIFEKVSENKDVGRGGNCYFKNLYDSKVIMGYDNFMHSTNSISAEPLENGKIKVVHNINNRPNDKYGRQLYNQTTTKYEEIIDFKDLLKVTLKIYLKILEAM